MELGPTKKVKQTRHNTAEKPCGGGGISKGVMYNMRPKLAARWLKREGKK